MRWKGMAVMLVVCGCLFGAGMEMVTLADDAPVVKDVPVSKMLAKARLEYETGHLDKAISGFAQILLRNSRHLQAQQYLSGLTSKVSAINEMQRQEILRLLDIVDYINFLKDNIGQLQRRNDEMVEFITRNAEFEMGMLDRVADLQQLMDEIKLTTDRTDGEVAVPETDMTATIQQFVQQKASLTLHQAHLQEIHRHLQQLKISLINRLREQPSGTKNVVISPETSGRASENAAVQRHIEKQAAALQSMQTELQTVRDRMAELQEQLVSTADRLDETTGELAGKTLESLEKQQQLADRDERIRNLEKELYDAGERMNLVQRLLEDKNQQIISLRQQMQQLTDGPSGTMAMPKDVAGAETNGLTSLSVRKLQEEYLLLAGRMEKQEKQILALKNHIDQQQYLIRMREFQLAQMDGIVKIYRGKLSDSTQEVRERDALLKRLQDRLEKIKAYYGQSRSSLLIKLPLLSKGERRGLRIPDLSRWSAVHILRGTQQGIGIIQRFNPETNSHRSMAGPDPVTSWNPHPEP